MPEPRPNALEVVYTNVISYGNVQEGIEQLLTSEPNLSIIAGAVIELSRSRGMQYTAVGARGFYADALAHAVIMNEQAQGNLYWFTIREQAKGHGRRSMTEGTRLASGQPVLLVDTVAMPDELLATCDDLVRTTDVQIAGVIPITEASPEVGAQITQHYPNAIYAPLIDSKFLAS